MILNSLLWLSDSKRCKINDSVIADLGLLSVYEKLLEISAQNEAIIYELCLDKETILYRQELLMDFFNEPNLLTDLSKHLDDFMDIKSKIYSKKSSTSGFFDLLYCVITVETTIHCLESLYDTLSYYKIKSKGLLQLKQTVDDTISTATFKQMKTDLKEIRYILSAVRSVEISMNLSYSQRPYEAQVTEINEYPYRFPKAFRKVSDTLERNQSFLGRHIKNYIPVFTVGALDCDLLDELEYAFRKEKPILNKFLSTYGNLDITPYTNLLKELTFYEASLNFLLNLKNQGLPLCMPSLIEAEQTTMHIEGLYNVRVALKNNYEKMVLNDFDLDENARIFILTGANRGGKTTFTQAVGQIQLLAQLGLMVPAKKAELSIVDGIFTHFPVLEKDTVDLGRLGKECLMFSSQFPHLTPKSFLLMNESFSGTSYLESLKIAEEAVKALIHKKLSAVFNTHLHELAETALEFNKELLGSKVVSIVAERDESGSTYRIVPSKPLGKSYAKDIAAKYGVTYEQLLESKGGVLHA